MIDLQGKKFGRLTVVQRLENHTTSGGNPVVMWSCVCSCGNETKVSSNSLSRGKVKSCGCYARELAAQKGALNKKHGGYSQQTSWGDRAKFQALVNIRERAKRRGYESDLEIGDLPILTDFCPVLGVKYVKGSLKSKDFVPSIDKKNPNLPYLKKYKANLIFISHRANRIKSDATVEELCKVYNFVKDLTWS